MFCLVDCVICLFFFDGYMFDMQVIINLILGDIDVLLDVLVVLVVSFVIVVLDIFFVVFFLEVCVVWIDGEYVINLNYSDLENVDLEIIVVVIMDNVMMVEGEVNECFEEELVGVIKVGYEVIKVQIKVQMELVEKVGEKVVNKCVFESLSLDEDIKVLVKEIIKDEIYKVVKGVLDKVQCKVVFKVVKEGMKEKLMEDKGEEWCEENMDVVKEVYNKFQKEVICEMVMVEKICLDGCKLDQVCLIWCEISYLFFMYGFVIFNCGEMQSFIFFMLGIKIDKVMVDKVLGLIYDEFILYYNFFVYLVGEIKLMCGFGCCEVGYVNLVGCLLCKVMLEDVFYIICIVSDIMEFNGFFFMVIVCVGILVLMDVGI